MSLKEMLDTGKKIKVTIRRGQLGCADAQDACREFGYLLLYKSGDNYRLDTPLPDDENIVCVDNEQYILGIVDTFGDLPE